MILQDLVPVLVQALPLLAESGEELAPYDFWDTVACARCEDLLRAEYAALLS